MPTSSRSMEQPPETLTSTLSWVGSQCVAQSACMSPLSAELAECSLYKHIKDHKGKPDMKRSLRWAVEVAKGKCVLLTRLVHYIVVLCCKE